MSKKPCNEIVRGSRRTQSASKRSAQIVDQQLTGLQGQRYQQQKSPIIDRIIPVVIFVLFAALAVVG